MKKIIVTFLLILITSISFARATIISKINIGNDTVLTVVCIQGYKFLVTSQHDYEGVKVELVPNTIQMTEVKDGKVVPMKCN